MKNESKVAILFISTVMLILFLFYQLGSFDLFSNSKEVHILYNFAGGIEVGSPVRAMGIRVGKVKKIQFDANKTTEEGEEVKLILTISIEEKAWDTIREDSDFYINLAGVIGEKYIEITPGSTASPKLVAGSYYRGVDPPRIDQLISQSYSLAGKIIALIESNEGDVINIIKNLDQLVANVNSALRMLNSLGPKANNNELIHLIKNLNQISGDVAHVSKRLRTEQSDETIDLIHELIWRLKDLDKEALKEFFQKEGVKARIF